MRYVVLEKKIGETPLSAVASWKQIHSTYTDVPASYAGRLDPMASGKLLVLLGDECKKQKTYTGLDKEYEVEVLLDVGSDTGDVLGRVSYEKIQTHVDRREVQRALEREKGTHLREYPIFSSKTVDGKPLFLHALSGTLKDISIPTHTETIYSLSVLSVTYISRVKLKNRVGALLARAPKSDEPSKVLGADFRIQEVKESWEKVFTDTERSFAVLKLRVTCGSGVYMRTLAGRIGSSLGTKALALSISRTRIGKYWAFGWWKEYK